jgi:hypothetical protein
MSLKAILFSLGCLFAWFVLLPTLVIGGGLALFAYAVFAEIGEFFTDNSSKDMDTSVARDMARRMCGGYGVQACNAGRLSSRPHLGGLSGAADPRSTSS